MTKKIKKKLGFDLRRIGTNRIGGVDAVRVFLISVIFIRAKNVIGGEIVAFRTRIVPTRRRSGCHGKWVVLILSWEMWNWMNLGEFDPKIGEVVERESRERKCMEMDRDEKWVYIWLVDRQMWWILNWFLTCFLCANCDFNILYVVVLSNHNY